jgi:hypothetical protein
MTMTLKVHFDGRVLVPDEPVHLPINCPLQVRVVEVKPLPKVKKPLLKLVEVARKFPVRQGPTDGVAQHDHYLYGLPKRS